MHKKTKLEPIVYKKKPCLHKAMFAKKGHVCTKKNQIRTNCLHQEKPCLQKKTLFAQKKGQVCTKKEQISTNCLHQDSPL